MGHRSIPYNYYLQSKLPEGGSSHDTSNSSINQKVVTEQEIHVSSVSASGIYDFTSGHEYILRQTGLLRAINAQVIHDAALKPYLNLNIQGETINQQT